MAGQGQPADSATPRPPRLQRPAPAAQQLLLLAHPQQHATQGQADDPRAAEAATQLQPATTTLLCLPVHLLAGELSGRLPASAKRRLRLACRQLRQAVDTGVTSLRVDRPDVDPATFPGLLRVQVRRGTVQACRRALCANPKMRLCTRMLLWQVVAAPRPCVRQHNRRHRTLHSTCLPW